MYSQEYINEMSEHLNGFHGYVRGIDGCQHNQQKPFLEKYNISKERFAKMTQGSVLAVMHGTAT